MGVSIVVAFVRPGIEWSPKYTCIEWQILLTPRSKWGSQDLSCEKLYAMIFAL